MNTTDTSKKMTVRETAIRNLGLCGLNITMLNMDTRNRESAESFAIRIAENGYKLILNRTNTNEFRSAANEIRRILRQIEAKLGK